MARAVTVVVYSASFGGYDAIRAPAAQTLEVEWHYYTDMSRGEAPWPWMIHEHYESPYHPNMTAKWYKTHPFDVAIGWSREPRYAIWVDANMEITSPTFVEEAVAAVENGIALFAHPRRDCIYAEAAASLGAEGQDGRYAALPLLEQVEHYRAQGHPEHGGLYAGGVVVWAKDEKIIRLAEHWWDQCRTWGYQDQLSLPIVLRGMDVTPGVFPFPQLERRRDGQFGNRWLIIHPHGGTT